MIKEIPFWVRIFVIVGVWFIVSYGVYDYSQRIGFYNACQSMGLDMLYDGENTRCDNLTKINMQIDAENKEMQKNMVLANQEMMDSLNKMFEDMK